MTLITAYTPRCHDITLLISESMERPLPLRTRLAMRIHYLACVWCERYNDQLGFLRKALHQSCKDGSEHFRGEMSEEFKSHLKDSLKEEL